MPTKSREFAAYIPEIVLRRLRKNPVLSPRGEGETWTAVVLFADIAESTRLANQLAKHGRLVGPEEMWGILNAYYGPLISRLHERGGDVIGFAGDAVMAVWPAPDEAQLGLATRQAVQAALEIQRQLNNMELAAGVRLSLRICISAGDLTTSLVGGCQGFWQLVAYGPPIDQIRAAEHELRVGEVLLSRQAREALGKQGLFDVQPSGGAFVRRLPSPPSPLPVEPTDVSTIPEEALRLFIPRAVQQSVDAGLNEFLDQSRTVSTIFVRIARSNAAPAKWDRLQAAMMVLQEAMSRYEGTVVQMIEDDKGLVSVLAFGLPPVGHEDDASRAIEAALYLRERAREFAVVCATGISTGVPFCGSLGGELRRVYTVIGADVIRAARLMQTANEGEILCDRETRVAARRPANCVFQTLPRFALKGFDAPVRVYRVAEADDISTSRSDVSLHSRRLCPTINDSADESTEPAAPPTPEEWEPVASAVRTRLLARELGPALVDRLQRCAGADALAAVQECDRLLAADRLAVDHGLCELIEPTDGAAEAEAADSKAAALVGREAERRVIAEALDRVQAGAARVVLIEGETGVGKSRLLEDLRATAEARGIVTVAGRCSSVEVATPYFPWRAIFHQRLASAGFHDVDSRQEHVLTLLDARPDLRPFAPLLNDVLGLQIPEDEVVRQMTGQTRADNLHDLLVSLLDVLAGDSPTQVQFDDAQWADSASWRLMKLVRERSLSVLIAVVLRRSESSLPDEFDELTNPDWCDRLTLTALTRPETIELAKTRLGTERIDDSLANLIWRRTQGSPLYVEQVVDHMASAGFIERRNGDALLRASSTGDVEPYVPDTIRGLIAARIDRLRPAHQLTAKVSSVIGPQFAGRTLCAVHPDPSARPLLFDHIDALARERIVREARPKPEDEYEFPHPVTEQVCYEMLPRSQRDRLHRAAAEWFEVDRHDGGAPPYRLIAHHWGRAGEHERQIEYLTKAGDAAMRDGAFREAVSSFTEALRFDAGTPLKLRSTAERARLAHTEHQLGLAYFGLGDLPTAQIHLRKGLEIRNRAGRSSKFGVVADGIYLLTKQAIRRIWPKRPSERAKADQAVRESTAAYLQLARINYYMNDLLPGTNATLRALDLADSVGPSPESAIAYAQMMILCSLLNFHGAARTYSRLSLATVREVGEMQNTAVVLAYLGMYRLGQGELSAVESFVLESLSLAERLGDQHQRGEAATVLAMRCCLAGEYQAAERWAAKVLEAAKRSGNTMHTGWALNIQGEVLLRLRRLSEAAPTLRESLAVLHGNKDRTEEIRIYGMLAEIAAVEGDLAEAARLADEAEAVAQATSAKTCSTLEGFAGVAEARFTIVEAQPEKERTPEAVQAGQKALDELRAYARLYPIGRPRLALFEGRMHLLHDAPSRAHRAWRDGLEQAVDLRMPYDAARLHERLADAYPDDSPERLEHEDAADKLYHEVGLRGRPSDE